MNKLTFQECLDVETSKMIKTTSLANFTEVNKRRVEREKGTRKYRPSFISKAHTYRQEVNEMRRLIEMYPSDVKELKNEYEILTGVRYKRSR